MKTKGLIFIIIIALICIGGCAYAILSQPTQYKNITMNGIVCEVPESSAKVIPQTQHYSIYNDSENGVAMYVFDSEGTGFGDISEMTSFAATREANQIGAQLEEDENYMYNYSSTLKEYTYLCNYTHKNVFVITENREDMLHILKTMKLDNEITLNINDTNETDNVTTVYYIESKAPKSNTSPSNDTPEPDVPPVNPEPIKPDNSSN